MEGERVATEKEARRRWARAAAAEVVAEAEVAVAVAVAVEAEAPAEVLLCLSDDNDEMDARRGARAFTAAVLALRSTSYNSRSMLLK
jgi:hypothetical protein